MAVVQPTLYPSYQAVMVMSTPGVNPPSVKVPSVAA